MRTALLVLPVLLVAFPTAMADETNLAGGSLITHYVPEIAYSTEPPPCGDWCCAYEGHEITDPSQENVRIDGPGGAVWYVLAAWGESKERCGVEYGFGAYDPWIFAFDVYGPCFPVQGLELPSGGWPGPNEGTALTVTGGDSWTGNWVPIYSFVGYAYTEVGRIPIDVDPVGSFVGFANCQNPPGIFPVAGNTPTESYRGAMGINTDGIRAMPGTPPPSAVCCVDVWCSIRTQAGCDELGGVWHPEWTSCDPNPCPFTPARDMSWGEIKTLYR